VGVVFVCCLYSVDVMQNCEGSLSRNKFLLVRMHSVPGAEAGREQNGSEPPRFGGPADLTGRKVVSPAASPGRAVAHIAFTAAFPR
jgi:hypothetical protein